MTIAIAALKDASALAALHSRSFDQGWPSADFTAHINAKTDDVVIARDDDGITGFIIMRTVETDSEILTLAVETRARGQGLGKALVLAGEVRAAARGARMVFLDVAADNPAAIHVYNRLGYYEYGQRPAYYRRANGRVAAHLLQKRIKSTV